MAGRSRPPPRHAYVDPRRGPPYPPELLDAPPYPRGPPVPHPYLEEELELQQAELRRMAADNRRLMDDRVALQRELAAAKEEIRRLNVAIGDIRMEGEAQARELIDKGMKLEADLRVAEPLHAEVQQLRAEMQKVNAVRQEQLQGLSQELQRAKAEAEQVPAIKAELDGLRQELMRARSALDYEKKGNAELILQRQATEKNLVSMARELEKLRADLAGREGRNWGPGGSYGMELSSSDAGYPSYGETHGLRSAVDEKSSLYTIGSGSWAGIEKPRPFRR